MHAHTYAHACRHTCSHTCTYMLTHMHTMLAHAHTNMHTHAHTYTHTCTHKHAHTHAHTYAHTHVHTQKQDTHKHGHKHRYTGTYTSGSTYEGVVASLPLVASPAGVSTCRCWGPHLSPRLRPRLPSPHYRIFQGTVWLVHGSEPQGGCRAPRSLSQGSTGKRPRPGTAGAAPPWPHGSGVKPGSWAEGPWCLRASRVPTWKAGLAMMPTCTAKPV